MKIHTLKELEKLGYNGIWDCLEVAVYDYCIMYRELPDNKIEIAYSTHEDTDYIYFKTCTFNKDTDVLKEYSWLDDGEIAQLMDFISDRVDRWLNVPLELKLFDISNYFGREEVFGSTDKEGFKVPSPVKK
jgi:hypothetical protein